jgi:hypothetical protein
MLHDSGESIATAIDFDGAENSLDSRCDHPRIDPSSSSVHVDALAETVLPTDSSQVIIADGIATKGGPAILAIS